VESDHAGDNRTVRWSACFLIIYFNIKLLMWTSKTQPTSDTSVFGEEFVIIETQEAYATNCEW